MIRLCFLLALMLVPPVAAKAQDALADPMRGLIWGLPADEVYGFEKAMFVEEKGGKFFFMDEIKISDGLKPRVLVEYSFDQAGLSGIAYYFMEKRTHPADTLSDALALQIWLDGALEEEGKPAFDFLYASDQNDPSSWGWVIHRGAASLTVTWQAPETQAVLRVTGEDFTPSTTLRLTPATHQRNAARNP